MLKWVSFPIAFVLFFYSVFLAFLSFVNVKTDSPYYCYDANQLDQAEPEREIVITSAEKENRLTIGFALNISRLSLEMSK